MDSETDAIAVTFTRCLAEIDRHLAEMRREQEAIEKTGARTDAKLVEIAEILSELSLAG